MVRTHAWIVAWALPAVTHSQFACLRNSQGIISPMCYQKQRWRYKYGVENRGHSGSWRIERIQAYLNDLRLRHA
jgi:hypothetical protein